jgi:hypothetical protein
MASTKKPTAGFLGLGIMVGGDVSVYCAWCTAHWAVCMTAFAHVDGQCLSILHACAVKESAVTACLCSDMQHVAGILVAYKSESSFTLLRLRSTR